MMVFAVHYKAAINDITGDRDLNYRIYELSNNDWVIIEDMVHTLEVFKHATLLFSSEEKSTIANVITTMDKIDNLLTTTIVSSSTRRPIHSSVRKALNLAKTTLNKYYSRMDTSNVYRIAMVLHPSLKLEYFRLRKWDQNWIDTAEQIVQDEFHLSYKSHDNADDVEIVEGGDAVCRLSP
ncbi:hypothetical protein DFH08DRAFT_694367 [Mycena albidolilacea]|uniref:hAT-like transposase RNase-H fold domain-containing protein n=1 Tax=Mycena albidolilacea TaxID=1033008 RepID=A0AAD7EVA8_9AGAR|nr:hypothetical protein DFH08DRAFT_694367 [Mycena albidolilacea]